MKSEVVKEEKIWKKGVESDMERRVEEVMDEKDGDNDDKKKNEKK